MLPDGHPGHLVLYGEIAEKGVLLLLRSPNFPEPRYYLLVDTGTAKQSFKDAEYETRQKHTQLLIGGKPRKGGTHGRDNGHGEGGGEGSQRSEGGPGHFHPAPVTDTGPSKPNP